MAHGDAVLATLGYTRVSRRPSASALTAAALVLGIAGIGWAGWTLYKRSLPALPEAGARAAAPSIAKPAANARRLGGDPDVSPGAAAVPAVIPQNPAVERPQGTNTNLPGVEAPRRSPSTSNAAVNSAPPAATAPPASANPSPSADSTGPGAADAEDLRLALYYHRAGDFENALQHYRALLQRNELNAQAHNNLGLLYQEKNLLEESSRELQRAVLIEPRNAGARNNLGVTLLMQGKLDEATAQFRAVLAVEPRNLDALVDLAIAQRSASQLDLAKETLVKALTIAPRHPAAHYNLGQLYDQTNEPARAVEHYRTFLETAGAEHAARAAAVRARIAALSRTPE